MPDAFGRFRGISVPELPWQREDPEPQVPRGDDKVWVGLDWGASDAVCYQGHPTLIATASDPLKPCGCMAEECPLDGVDRSLDCESRQYCSALAQAD